MKFRMDFQFNRMEGKRNSRKEYFDPTGTPTDFDLIRRLHVLTFRYTDRFRERVPAAKVFKLLSDVRGMSRMAGTN